MAYRKAHRLPNQIVGSFILRADKVGWETMLAQIVQMGAQALPTEIRLHRKAASFI